jgi:hypothetical protein
MTIKRALQIVFAIALFGATFSGVLTYRELFGQSALTCPSPGQPGTVFGYPACVYGFFMYLAISIVAGWGLLASRHIRRVAPPRGTSSHVLPLQVIK